ncbi:hypothetical protein [Sporosarcina sp. HYO08]|uniref:hypothetical protein n=1 Tax=Sporosarcina sp. HYO08 TaxID=1759557 RepID=UPI00079B6DF9|nr:hypothetical protein [Sporosarcina sp. HYO08]KXH79795.1 hypothetical protein AU377_09925 [Sporosarcina sp. HYO08]
MKKDVLIILRHEPLLFVKTPPVYMKLTVKDEESTSVFTFSGRVQESSLEEGEEVVTEMQFEELEEEKEKPQLKNGVVNPDLIRKIHTLSTPFSRQVYRPLEFVLDEEKLIGTIEKMEEETLFILLEGEEQELVAIDIGTIEEIFWRGTPFEGD